MRSLLLCPITDYFYSIGLPKKQYFQWFNLIFLPTNGKFWEQKSTCQATGVNGGPFVESSLQRQLKEAARGIAAVWKKKSAKEFK